MVRPSVVIKDGMGGRRFTDLSPGVLAIISELFQLSLQINCVPDKHVIKKLPPYRPGPEFFAFYGTVQAYENPLPARLHAHAADTKFGLLPLFWRQDSPAEGT